MRTSFISEHSIEYLIVPKIWDLLKQKFGKIVPIYFWVAREGNSLSKEIHKGQILKVLSVFPRRPKIERSDLNQVYGKINDTIIKYSKEAKSLGIPSIFCFPIISSLNDIANEITILSLEVVNHELEDIHFVVNKDTRKLKVENRQGNTISSLSDNNILTLVTHAKDYSWEKAILAIKELRRLNLNNGDRYGGFRFYWMNSYKPIYFLIFA